eukprot:TRINITY_DN41369_c0_g1_i1.p1 TRINITY_DN41369_c0_g1~~TRINITY_DN41369_c0_g1_i1.p1  ORF type:complete len:279 (+),score=71.36 TRINITY_DN41369_c0_g1_i1:87-923(+)
MAAAAGEDTEELQLWDPAEPPKQITLRLIMEKSLTKDELQKYDALPAEGALERVQALKSLHLQWLGIGEIAGLEPFESAEVLYLQANRLQRIEGLESLSRLQFLALQMNQITVVENLLCLPDLEFLDLSSNRIAELDCQQLPQKINMLNLRENACTRSKDYKSRLLARLPDLYTLDGVDLEEAQQPAGSTAAREAAEQGALPDAADDNRGLAAYWKRDQLQAGMTADMKDRIEAYSLEALAEAGDELSRRVEDAAARSRARREAMPLPSPLATKEIAP